MKWRMEWQTINKCKCKLSIRKILLHRELEVKFEKFPYKQIRSLIVVISAPSSQHSIHLTIMNKNIFYVVCCELCEFCTLLNVVCCSSMDV